MSAFKLMYSFRVRLLLVLALLLIATLSVQYYLNLRTARNNARIRAEQEQAIMAGVALGMSSISSGDYIVNLQKKAKQPVAAENSGRVSNILIVDNEGRIVDSLKSYNPVPDTDGTLRYTYLKDIRKDLPPLINAVELPGEDAQLLQPAPPAAQPRMGDPRAIPIPVVTEQGRWYVIVVLGTATMPTSFLNRQVAGPLLYTLAVLLVATSIAAALVWRFTRPIKDLSAAARRVAAGDLSFRVPGVERRDEMGQLAQRFNEMIVRLEHTRELESQLHQAEQSAVVGRLASAIAHEIRNPLNFINLSLDHLRTSYSPDDPAKREKFARLAEQLKAEVARINTLISDFLNYSRPSHIEPRPIDLREAAEDAMRMVEVKATESNIETSIEQQGNVPKVPADPEALRSIFTNLYINALQAIDGESGSLSVNISATDEGRRACIEITDTGRGIPPENISQVFEPYFSTKETGTGLGLAIVKKAIDDHGGTISVKSKHGSSTTFTITLPTEGER